MSPTVRDVAARAGVSIKTVSNVVHGRAGRTSAATTARVQRAIAELGYRPNLAARRLRTGNSQIIALALPDLRNPYFAQLSVAVIEAARERGYTVFIEATDGDAEAEMHAAEAMHDPLIAGVILSPLGIEPEQLAMRASTVPLVLLGDRTYDIPAVHVGYDNVAASHLLTSHLIEQGYRRIGVVGNQSEPNRPTAHTRLSGYRQALQDAGIAFDPELAPTVGPAPYDMAMGAEAMKRLLVLSSRPDAVYCLADVLAVGALHELHVHGLTVPDDMAMAAFDGTELSRFMVPTLTSLAPDIVELSQLAVGAVIDGNGADGDANRVRLCAFQLVVGESTAPRSQSTSRRLRQR
jgi:DNA-binding LacI/PurR family transcriptional regulator